MTFIVIEDAYAILKNRSGVYRQTKVYQRSGRLYATHGGGFIYLTHRNGTSVPDVRLDELEVPFKLKMTETGFLVHPDTFKEKMIPVK